MQIVPTASITIDPDAKSITLSGDYASLTLVQISRIVNLSTNSVLYTGNPGQTISLGSGVITLPSDARIASASDNIKIEFIPSETTVEIKGYNRTLGAVPTLDISPPDAQIMRRPPLLNAVTASATSTGTYVLDKSRLTFMVVTSGTVSGSVDFETSPDGSADWDAIAAYPDGSETSAKTHSLTTVGTFVFNIPRAALPWLRANLTVTSGTFTIYLFGGAL